MGELLQTPPVTHVVYIPAVIIVGIIIGFIIGRKAGVKEGQARFLGAGNEDDDLL
ncbi:MAG: hypothetical protein KC549_00735 [Myxococcales bacterium]|nr:hypothetical protein [Myxococcales bacterium]MCB9544571.1 hypothetical protein [Myxococcales bacterium]